MVIIIRKYQMYFRFLQLFIQKFISHKHIKTTHYYINIISILLLPILFSNTFCFNCYNGIFRHYFQLSPRVPKLLAEFGNWEKIKQYQAVLPTIGLRILRRDCFL